MGLDSANAKAWAVGPGIFRLFLAIMVMVHHSLPLRLGSWAVDVFFILSGYWITRMWDSRYSRTQMSYVTFVVSRWWRLAPVFFVCLAIGLSSTVILRGPGILVLLDRPTWWIRQLAIAGSSDAGRILPPTWSLDVEMQFYILAPLLIYCFKRLGLRARWFLIAGLSIIPSVFFFRGTPVDTARVGLFGGFFLAGTALALSDWVADRLTAIGGGILLVGGTISLALFTPVRTGIWCDGSFGTLPTPWVSSWWIVAALLIVPFVSRNVHVPSSTFDRVLGNLAYPLYLFHWIPREWYYRLCETNSSSLVRAGLLVANFTVAIGGATLILLLVDQPIDRLRAKWVASRRLRAGQSAGIAIREGAGEKASA
jgi:peptidoglycan/LPS O-acetylase OafA/YrhL